VKRPIVVTGSHRSGTTWVGRMLCLSGEAGYIHEPLNPVRRPSWMTHPVPYWYVYVTEDNAHLYEADLERAMAFRFPLRNVVRVRRPAQAGMLMSDLRRSVRPRLSKARPLLKDPFALFSAAWFERRYDADVVITVRNPVAFVGSIKRLNWQFKFKTLLAQGALMEDWLHPFETDMRRCRDEEVGVVDQGIVLWNVLHHAIDRLRADHPGWAVVRHEDLSRDPLGGFADLYRRCGLTWNADVERSVAGFSSADSGAELPMWRHGSVKRDSAGATETWKSRLTEEEAERVRAGTSEVAARFYGDAATSS
jgi:hypothetical protein